MTTSCKSTTICVKFHRSREAEPCIQQTVRYTEVSPDRSKDFWQ
jgi:hypothetical protein